MMSERMNMGMAIPGKKVMYEPRPVRDDALQAVRPSVQAGERIDLSNGAILSHPHSSIGKKVLYDPITESVIGYIS